MACSEQTSRRNDGSGTVIATTGGQAACWDHGKRSDRRKIYFAQPVVKGSFHDHRPDPPYAASPRRRLVADGSGRCRGAGGGHGGRRAENGVRPLRGINHYFFLPEPK